MVWYGDPRDYPIFETGLVTYAPAASKAAVKAAAAATQAARFGQDASMLNGVGQMAGVGMVGPIGPMGPAGPAGPVGEIGPPGIAEATPTAWPIVVAGAIAGVGLRMSLGMLKTLFARYGPTALKALIGAAAFKEFLDLIGVGAPDDTEVSIRKGRRRRYSIGANPRMNTLIKVAKHVDNIFIRYDKRMQKFRSRIRGPARRRPHYGYGPQAYLSPVERKQLARG